MPLRERDSGWQATTLAFAHKCTRRLSAGAGSRSPRVGGPMPLPRTRLRQASHHTRPSLCILAKAVRRSRRTITRRACGRHARARGSGWRANRGPDHDTKAPSGICSPCSVEGSALFVAIHRCRNYVTPSDFDANHGSRPRREPCIGHTTCYRSVSSTSSRAGRRQPPTTSV